MPFVVAKTVLTQTRRIPPGTPVSPADIEGAVSFDRWVEMQHIVEAPAPSTPAASEPTASQPAADADHQQEPTDRPA
ncbi:MAG: hypothetical protein P4M09_22515 [Devosia sp.]|nr:hypothetical protein [Devosia sp.]